MRDEYSFFLVLMMKFHQLLECPLNKHLKTVSESRMLWNLVLPLRFDYVLMLYELHLWLNFEKGCWRWTSLEVISTN